MPPSPRVALEALSAQNLFRACERVLANTLHCSYACRMDELRFEWDPVKAAANLKKQGIDFVEAKSVFAD